MTLKLKIINNIPFFSKLTIYTWFIVLFIWYEFFLKEAK